MLLVIVGPTGSGKTSAALKLADFYHAPIINADAFQIYSEMDIGTAKIARDSEDYKKHYLLDIVKPSQRYSVKEYQDDFRRVYAELNKQYQNIIVCGGTGLYIKAALYDYAFEDEEEADISDLEELSNEELADILNKLEEAKNNDFGTLLQEFKKQYRPQYIVSLNNNFSSGSTGVRKVTLSSDDLSHLLSAITKEYNDYFVETYQDISIPANQIAAMNVDLLDFLEILDKTSDFLTDLAEYCVNRDKLVPGFRSSDGLSFENLSETIVGLKDAKINGLYADIFLDNVCKDKYLLLSNYESRKQEIKIQLDTLTESIDKLNYDIEHYTPDSIVIKTPGGADVGPIEVNSEYYNALVLQYMELQQEKTKLEQEQSTIDFRISKLEGADPTPEQIAAIDAEVQSVLEKADELYTMVNESSEQLFKSNAYQNRYMHSITTSERESLKDNLKLFLIGAAAGVGLGFVLWVADAFVLEFRNVKRHNDEMEAE